ncbi:hypothetical protein TUA1478L_20520 [Lactiplantibacillus plantarum]
MTTSTLTGQQLLIYGTGQIGQSLAAKASALGMHVIGVNTTGHPADHFHETVAFTATADALATANFIVNALPLTPTTHHLFSTELFQQTKQQPMLINIGRGPAVDTTALMTAWIIINSVWQRWTLLNQSHYRRTTRCGNEMTC